jgi:MFS family permease
MNSSGLRTVAVFSVGYFLSYLFRGINLGFAPFLSNELGLNATDLGALTSAYFLGFACAQVPTGVLLDRYGPRRVTALIILSAALGAMMFGASSGVQGMMLGRLLIGVGSAVCLSGAFKANAYRFSFDRLTAANGVVVAVGGLGGVMVGAPLAILLEHASWRTISVGLALVTVCVAAIIWFAAPTGQASLAKTTLRDQLRGTLLILRSRTFWKLGLFSGLTQIVFGLMQSLWVGAFLRDVTTYGMSGGTTYVGFFISVLGVSFMVGNLGLGLFAAVLARRGVSVQMSSGVLMLLFVVVQGLIAFRIPLPDPVLWASYGALGGAGILTFSVLAVRFPREMAGRVTTTFNLVIFVGIFVAQISIGQVLSHWHADAGHYPVIAHQATWVVLVAVQLLAAVLYFFPERRVATKPAFIEQ